MTLSLPSPHEPFVDLQTGKVSEIWYRYLTQNLISANDATTIELTATAPLSISTANVISASLAAQADEETGTSSTALITPSVQQYHPSAAKAWGSVLLAGTVATLNLGYNVNTVVYTTLSGAHDGLIVNLATPFSSSHYGVVSNTLLSSVNQVDFTSIISRATSTFTIVAGSTVGTPPGFAFVCYGDQ